MNFTITIASGHAIPVTLPKYPELEDILLYTQYAISQVLTHKEYIIQMTKMVAEAIQILLRYPNGNISSILIDNDTISVKKVSE